MLNTDKVKMVLIPIALLLYGFALLLLSPLWALLWFFSPNDVPYKEGKLLFLHYPRIIEGRVVFWKYVYFVEYYMGDTSIRELSDKEVEEVISAQRRA